MVDMVPVLTLAEYWVNHRSKSWGYVTVLAAVVMQSNGFVLNYSGININGSGPGDSCTDDHVNSL